MWDSITSVTQRAMKSEEKGESKDVVLGLTSSIEVRCVCNEKRPSGRPSNGP